MKKLTAWLLPFLFFVASLVVLYPAVQQDFHSSWVRWEFYSTAALMVGFCLLLALYLYSNLQQAHWTQRYLLSAGVILPLPFYYYVGLTSGHDIPLVFGFLLVSILYVMPLLALLHGVAFLIRKGQH